MSHTPHLVNKLIDNHNALQIHSDKTIHSSQSTTSLQNVFSWQTRRIAQLKLGEEVKGMKLI